MFKYHIGELVLYKMPTGIKDTLGMITKQVETKYKSYDIEWYNQNGTIPTYAYLEEEVDIFRMDYINAQGR
jgi:hypothetical protein